jgi:hypothetical protein
MTDSNEDVTTNDNSAQKPAGDLPQPSAEIDVNGLAAEVSEAQSRLRAQLAEVREGFDELKLHLQHTASLKDKTKVDVKWEHRWQHVVVVSTILPHRCTPFVFERVCCVVTPRSRVFS